MTLKKIAEITGFSLSTVSKSFSNSEEIPEETKKLIFDTAKKLGLYDKYIKISNKKPVVAVVCPEICSEYYTNIVDKLRIALKEHDYLSTVSTTDFKLKTEQELITYYTAYAKVDGIIVVDGKTQAKRYSPIPIIYFGGNADNPYADVIRLNRYTGYCDAVKLLKQLGHTKIGFIGDKFNVQKSELLKKILSDNGLNVYEELFITRQDRFENAGYHGVNQLINANTLPTAIFAGYDYIALGIMKRLNEKNIKVPEEISLIGNDDITFSSFYNTSLSTISYDVDSTAKLVVDILIDKIKNKYKNLIQHVNIRTEFIKRESVGFCKK